MKRVIVAGGSCGASMERASEKIDEYCHKKGVKVKVSMHNLWHSKHLDPRVDLVVQMFPYFENIGCPVLDGRPFIKGHGEEELLYEVAELLAHNNL